MSEKVDAKEANRRSRSIDRLLADEHKRIQQDGRIPCLILGASDAGKTTLLKQLKICFGGGFSDREREAYRVQIWENLVECFQALIDGCALLGLQIEPEIDAGYAQQILDYRLDPETEKFIMDVLAVSVNSPSDSRSPTSTSSLRSMHKLSQSTRELPALPRWQMPTDLANAMLKLCNNSIIQKGFEQRQKIHLHETTEYFFDSLERIIELGYVPTDLDILHIRKSNTTITETKLHLDGCNITLYDVAGQRKFRKAWIPFFDNAQCILFLMSLSSFDQTLVEDPNVNRMTDAIDLFHRIAENPLLKNAGLMLFMNKADLFEKKLNHVKIADHFKDFKGDNSFKNGTRFFRMLFWECKVDPDRTMITHVTTATDPVTMKMICLAVA